MKVEVRYFASLVELTGRTSETLEVEDGTDVRTVWAVLVDRIAVWIAVHGLVDEQELVSVLEGLGHHSASLGRRSGLSGRFVAAGASRDP